MENESKPQEQTPETNEVKVDEANVSTESSIEVAETVEQAPKKVSKLVISVIAVVLMLVAVGVYIFALSGDEASTETSETNPAIDSEALPVNEGEEQPVPEVVQWESALYPVIKLNLFEGWEASEPEDYKEDGTVAADIILTNGSTTVTLPITGAFVAGFIGNDCYADPNLEVIAETTNHTYIRFERDSQYSYASVSLEGTDGFESAQENPDFVGELDENPAFCLGTAPIATSQTPVEFSGDDLGGLDINEDGFVDLWLWKIYTDTTDIDEVALSQLDAMIGELLQSLN